jgi:hypothetical protein
MLERDVVGGVHRIGEYFVNWYLIEERRRDNRCRVGA